MNKFITQSIETTTVIITVLAIFCLIIFLFDYFFSDTGESCEVHYHNVLKPFCEKQGGEIFFRQGLSCNEACCKIGEKTRVIYSYGYAGHFTEKDKYNYGFCEKK